MLASLTALHSGAVTVTQCVRLDIRTPYSYVRAPAILRSRWRRDANKLDSLRLLSPRRDARRPLQPRGRHVPLRRSWKPNYRSDCQRPLPRGSISEKRRARLATKEETQSRPYDTEKAAKREDFTYALHSK